MKKLLKYLVIHCSATPEGQDITADQIRKWHTSPPPAGRGWKQVGYSQLFYLNGDIITMVGDNGDQWVDSNEITNGASGINGESKHICYIGGVDKKNNPKDTRTIEQRRSMENYILDFTEKNPKILIAGHYHFAKKACPSFDVEKWLKEIGIQDINIYKK